MNKKTDCQNLIDKYLSNTISIIELNQLLQLVKETDVNEDLTASLNDHWESAIQINAENEPYWDKKFATIVQAESRITPNITIDPPKIKKRFYHSFTKAAMLLVVIGFIYVFFLPDGKQPVLNTISQVIKKNIMLGNNKAFLTLSNGKNILLDSATNGLLIQQNNVNIIKSSSGQLIYKNTSNLQSAHEVSYNTLQTTRGGQYQLTLPDSTKVWLNSASSIHFPTSFTGIDRKVEVTGEVYFEVAKNKAKPFTVNVNGMDVKVIGTHFNINAYNDDNVIKTTLLEGSVWITKGDNTLLLKPGNQAQLNNYGEIKLLKNADIEEATAWKKGYFYFKNSSLQNVMRQLSRWYDVEVIYEGTIAERTFGGEISRNLAVSEILQILDKSKVHFKVEGRKIIVKSY